VPTGSADRARRAAAAIEGWLTDAEGRLLFELAARCPVDLAIVEIGSWKGKSTVWIASGAERTRAPRVFAIDPHERSLENPASSTLDDFMNNLRQAGLADAVAPIVAASRDAARTFTRTPGFVFIDGSHLEAAVRTDLEDWVAKLPDGGVVALHDILNERWSGPRRALRGRLWSAADLTGAQFVDSIAWMRKTARANLGDRLRNKMICLWLTAYDLKALGLPAPIMSALRYVYQRTPLKQQRQS
jgi:predicted O-methyltransferase YrrM